MLKILTKLFCLHDWRSGIMRSRVFTNDFAEDIELEDSYVKICAKCRRVKIIEFNQINL